MTESPPGLTVTVRSPTERIRSRDGFDEDPCQLLRSDALHPVSLAVLGLLVLTVLPASAATYTPGVRAGDNVKYSNLNASWSSTVSGAQKPQFITDIQNTNFLLLNIQSVTGANVTAKITWDFKNGTAERSQTLVGNVQDGVGNLTSSSSSILLLVAGRLAAGDKIQDITNAPTFNSTTTRSYIGASREVNLLNVTQSSSGGGFSFSFHGLAYFNKLTGAVLEESINISSTGSTGSTTTSASLTATETSLWSATLFGMSPVVFYGIMGAVVAVIVIIAAVLLMKRRKPAAAPPMVPPTTPPAANP